MSTYDTLDVDAPVSGLSDELDLDALGLLPEPVFHEPPLPEPEDAVEVFAAEPVESPSEIDQFHEDIGLPANWQEPERIYRWHGVPLSRHRDLIRDATKSEHEALIEMLVAVHAIRRRSHWCGVGNEPATTLFELTGLYRPLQMSSRCKARSRAVAYFDETLPPYRLLQPHLSEIRDILKRGLPAWRHLRSQLASEDPAVYSQATALIDHLRKILRRIDHRLVSFPN